MKNINYFLACIILISLSFKSIGQSESNYEKEEINVVNQFLSRLLQNARLETLYDSDSILILFFKPELICELDQNPLFIKEYKSNRFLKNIEHEGLGQRIIDSLEIRKLDHIKIVFKYNKEYNLEEFNHHKVLGELAISRISFNKSLKIGYFYYQTFCGEDCGWGGLVKIKKKHGIWKITKYLISYIS